MDDPDPTRLPDLIDDGLRMVAERLEAAPDFGPYAAIQNELAWMRQIVQSDATPSAADVNRLTLGALAVREFEASDPASSDVLSRAE